MFKQLLLSIITFTLISCSNVNTTSQDHYHSKQKMRHGIIPIPTVKNAKVKQGITPPNQDSVARGKQIYLKNCYTCHGLDGKGKGPGSIDLQVKPRNLIKIVKEVPNFRFFMAISQWQGKMPGWINVLSEKELDDVKSYIQHLALSKEKPSF